MSLIKWNPLNIEKFFDNDFKFPDFGNLANLTKDLAFDVYEKDGKVFVEMQAAGINPEKIDMVLEDNYLKISGIREEEKEEKGKNYYTKQISRGSFQKIVPLEYEVEEDKIDAEFENGLLKIELPIKNFEEKKEEKKKITIKVKK